MHYVCIICYKDHFMQRTYMISGPDRNFMHLLSTSKNQLEKNYARILDVQNIRWLWIEYEQALITISWWFMCNYYMVIFLQSNFFFSNNPSSSSLSCRFANLWSCKSSSLLSACNVICGLICNATLLQNCTSFSCRKICLTHF